MTRAQKVSFHEYILVMIYGFISIYFSFHMHAVGLSTESIQTFLSLFAGYNMEEKIRKYRSLEVLNDRTRAGSICSGEAATIKSEIN